VGWASPLVERTGNARWVAEAGRAATIWLPVYALSAGTHSSLATAVAADLLVTGIWFLALRSAFSAVPFTLGPAVPGAVGTLTGLVAVSAVNLWLPSMQLPLPTLLFLAISVFVLSTAWETVWQRLLVARRRVLVVGTSSCASEVVDAVARADESPFTVVGMVNQQRKTDTVPGAPFLGPIADLSRIVEAQRPDLIVLAEGESPERALNSLLDVASGGFKVVGVTHFFEHAFGWVPLWHLTPTWFMSILHLHQRPYTRFAKRTFDVVVASVGLLFAAPLMLLIAVLVRLTPGRVIYRQTRVGEGGRNFTMYKFRTMRKDAEEPGRPVFAEEHDPRVTSAGRLLRNTHLDELPQLWNVLKGEMSMVGPRPERPEFAQMLEDSVPFLARRLLIKPGITGWAQLRCDYASDSQSTADRLSYDLWYLRHRNLIVDFAICAKTFSALLLHHGR
jgi:exopolysaccharide biosynthesis polyprenyl glycosylphosphotransferase